MPNSLLVLATGCRWTFRPGHGKTSVMAAWLVVDRRAVVDQATREVENLWNWVDDNADVKLQLGLDSVRLLAISTRRGKYVDNRQWLEDPSAFAIINA